MAISPVINTPSGQTVTRESMILYLNTGTSTSPVWSPIGKRVSDSNMELDWSTNTEQDILGDTYTTAKKPVITQSFDPYKVDSGDAALEKVIELAVVDHDSQALCNLDCLIVHFYAGPTNSPFAERYPASAIVLTSLGGEGGGDLEGAFDVTFGGTRQKGTASKDTDGTVTFTPSA